MWPCTLQLWPWVFYCKQVTPSFPVTSSFHISPKPSGWQRPRRAPLRPLGRRPARGFLPCFTGGGCDCKQGRGWGLAHPHPLSTSRSCSAPSSHGHRTRAGQRHDLTAVSASCGGHRHGRPGRGDGSSEVRGKRAVGSGWACCIHGPDVPGMAACPRHGGGDGAGAPGGLWGARCVHSP